MTTPGPMETMVEATARLRADGYEMDFDAVAGAKLRCDACGEIVDAHEVTVAESVRFEGESNPDDEAILYAIVMPSGHRGVFSAAYGPDISPEDVDVLRALAGR